MRNGRECHEKLVLGGSEWTLPVVKNLSRKLKFLTTKSLEYPHENIFLSFQTWTVFSVNTGGPSMELSLLIAESDDRVFPTERRSDFFDEISSIYWPILEEVCSKIKYVLFKTDQGILVYLMSNLFAHFVFWFQSMTPQQQFLKCWIECHPLRCCSHHTWGQCFWWFVNCCVGSRVGVSCCKYLLVKGKDSFQISSAAIKIHITIRKSAG